MIQQNYKVEALPKDELQQLGLMKSGKFVIAREVQEALLAGRRTELLRFNNLETENFKIPQLEAKLSLQPGEGGKLKLLVHPIYKEASYPAYLNDMDAAELESGQSSSITKKIADGKGGEKEILVEFDKDTKEFVITDTNRIVAPDMVNNQKLTAGQKEQYKKGKEVEIPDGTVLQFSAVEKHNMRSNKLALVASLVIDGGISFVLFKSLNYLFNKKPEAANRVKFSEQYKEALEDMRQQQNSSKEVATVEQVSSGIRR